MWAVSVFVRVTDGIVFRKSDVGEKSQNETHLSSFFQSPKVISDLFVLFYCVLTRCKSELQLLASLPECDLPQVPCRHVLIGWMESNESNNTCTGGEGGSFYIPLFVFVYWMCVCACVCTVGECHRSLGCVIVLAVSPSVCVYICTKFYFASLIQNNIVYRFYSVRNDPDVQRGVFF